MLFFESELLDVVEEFWVFSLLLEKLPDLNPSLLFALELFEESVSVELLVLLFDEPLLILFFEELLLDDLFDDELLMEPDLKPLLDFELLDFELEDLLLELDLVLAYTCVLSVGVIPDILRISIGRLLKENTNVISNIKISFLFILRMSNTSLTFKLTILYYICLKGNNIQWKE